MFSETEDAHEKAWVSLCKEFSDQKPILMYLYGTYMPIRAQWARCFIKKYRNFGIRVTSGTEASNNNIKSYLLNGMSNLYRLVEAIQDMLADQERDFAEACAQDEVLTLRDHTGPGAEYLGELPKVISQKGLRLITSEYRAAKAAIPSSSNAWPAPLGPCDDDSCSVSVELGIPCRHTIFSKLGSNTRLTKWDVHPRWHLRESTTRDPYRRILDPKVATSLRGRPKKNTAQALPAQLDVEQFCPEAQSQSRRGRGQRRGSRNAPSSSRAGRTRGRLGRGRTTGVRATGQRVQVSIRRRRSQWELSSDDPLLDGREGGGGM